MAKILLGISNGLLKNGNYYPSGFMEQIIAELSNCGNDVLVYVPNRFQKKLFGSDNALLDETNSDKLDADIKQFKPDLVLTFNNTIYNKVIHLTDCPVVVWGADAETYWNATDTIKHNLDKYFFFCFSEQEIKPRQAFFGAKSDRMFLMKPATNIRNTSSPKDKNISFIGTCFEISPYWLNLIEKYRGSHALRVLCNNFSSYFTGTADLLKDIDNELLSDDFKHIPTGEYVRFFSGEKRIQTLMNIADLGLHIWGDQNWERIKPLLPSLYASLHKEAVTTVKENEEVYNTSKICININHDQSINGMNFRICDVLASGGCLISSYSPFVQEQFKELPIPMFINSFVARELCKKYLYDEKLRSDFVEQSNAVIDKGWRWEQRFKEMEKALNITLCHKGGPGKISYLQPLFRGGTIRPEFMRIVKDKIRYKIWKYLDNKLRQKGIIK